MKKLNLGCGDDIKEGWDNVDIQKNKKITKSFDFNKFPYPIEDNTYDYIYTDNVLEHLKEPDKVVQELWRIAKNNGIINIVVPHYTNKGAYSCLEHKRFFNEDCFIHLEKQVNKINPKKEFEIIKLEITPTVVGKFFPKYVREKLSLFINGLLSKIDVKLKVVK